MYALVMWVQSHDGKSLSFSIGHEFAPLWSVVICTHSAFGSATQYFSWSHEVPSFTHKSGFGWTEKHPVPTCRVAFHGNVYFRKQSLQSDTPLRQWALGWIGAEAFAKIICCKKYIHSRVMKCNLHDNARSLRDGHHNFRPSQVWPVSKQTREKSRKVEWTHSSNFISLGGGARKFQKFFRPL